jgi:hypothetical protein
MIRNARVLAVLASLLTLLSSFVYSIAITRKISMAGLGLLSLLNASTGFSLLPNTVLSFVYPRLSARDDGLNVRATLGVSLVFYLVSTVMTIAYLAAVWGEMGGYAVPVLIIALLVEVSTYLQTIAGSVLLIRSTRNAVFIIMIQPILKIISVPVIMLLHWSIIAVLWATFFVAFVPAAYAFTLAFRFHVGIHNMRRYLREVINASWVPLMGYAANHFRSLDAMVIGLLGYAQLSVWYVIGRFNKPFTLTTALFGVTYAELLTRDRVGIVYRDFLIVLFLNTYVALALALFPDVFINLLRPDLSNEVNVLVLPMLLMIMNNIANNASQFISNVMQGVDKRDLASEAISAKSYIGSLILRAHLGEFITTITYLATLAPLILLYQHIGTQYYVVDGAYTASLLAIIVSMLFKLSGFKQAKSLFRWRDLATDYAAPLIISTSILEITRQITPLALSPSIYVSLLQATEVMLLVLATYLGTSIIISKTMRRLVKVMLGRLIKRLTEGVIIQTQ